METVTTKAQGGEIRMAEAVLHVYPVGTNTDRRRERDNLVKYLWV